MAAPKKLTARWTPALAEAGLSFIRGTSTREPFGKTGDDYFDLRGIPIRGAFRPDGVTLNHVDFTGLDADHRVIFANSALSDCRFDHARQRWGDFYSSFERLSFRKAKMAGSGFGSSYSDCDFSSADLKGSTGHKPIFTRCLFDQTKFSDSVLRDCTFIECKFSGAIRGVIFGGDFGLMKGCDLTQASFTGCTFNNFQFENCCTSESTLIFDNWSDAVGRFSRKLECEPDTELVKAGREWLGVWAERSDFTKDHLVDVADLIESDGPTIGPALFQLYRSVQ